MANVPRVSLDVNNVEVGKLVLVDGTIIEVPLGFRDLVNGGVIFDAAAVKSVTRDGSDLKVAEVLGMGADQAEGETLVWLPGSQLARIILSTAQASGNRAGFFS